MSKLCCVFCGVPFNPGKMNRKGFCSVKCWRKFEKLNASHNCLGVGRMKAQEKQLIKNRKARLVKRMRLEDLLEETKKDFNINERFSVGISPMTDAGRQSIKELQNWIKQWKIENKVN